MLKDENDRGARFGKIIGSDFAINILSVFSPDAFNEASHFMGTFWAVQYLLQPLLIFGVVFHFVMGFILEIKNRNARAVKYASFKGGANSSWASRNMIISGVVVWGALVVLLLLSLLVVAGAVEECTEACLAKLAR